MELAALDFEKPIATLEKKLTDLREISQKDGVDLTAEIKALEAKVSELTRDIFSRLTPWQRVQLSRHPNRPYASDYIEALFPSFMEIQGDRAFGADHALLSGIAEWPPKGSDSNQKKKSVLILAHQKGRTTQQKMLRNFGMAKPEGYRKAIRLMELAHRFKIPILTLVDTPGAYPGIETEERGQAQAIAESLRVMFEIDVPVLSVVIGEGGSGGALAIAVADTVMMQEFATYSVISPEGCASILWSDSKLASQASDVLKMAPKDLLKLGVIDGIISEPLGGAHRNWNETFSLMGKALVKNMGSFFAESKGTRKTAKAKVSVRETRYDKFRAMGVASLGKASSKNGSSTSGKTSKGRSLS